MDKSLSEIIQEARDCAAPGYEDWAEHLVRSAFELGSDSEAERYKGQSPPPLAALAEAVRERIVI